MAVPNDIKIYIGMLQIAISDETDPERAMALTSTLLSVVRSCLQNNMISVSEIPESEIKVDLKKIDDCVKIWRNLRSTVSYVVGKNDWKAVLMHCGDMNQVVWEIILKYGLVAFKDNAFAKFGQWSANK